MQSRQVYRYLKVFKSAQALSDVSSIPPPRGLNVSWLPGLIAEGLIADHKHYLKPIQAGRMPGIERRYYLTAKGVEQMDSYRINKRDRWITRGLALTAIIISVVALLSELKVIQLRQQPKEQSRIESRFRVDVG